MTPTEISRLETRFEDRINRMELRQDAKTVEHEASIEKILIAHANSVSKTTKAFAWSMGIVFTVITSVGAFIALDHFKVKDTVGTHEYALKIVIGKMNESDPGVTIEDLDGQFNPSRSSRSSKN